MNERENIKEKDEMWVRFVTYIQMYGSKKNKQEKASILEFIATYVDSSDKFFSSFLERTDVYEAPGFPEVLLSILRRLIYHRNVPLFKRFVYDFSPIYIRYLSYSPEFLSNKSIVEVLNVLLLSYPLTRDFLQNKLQEVLNEFIGVISNMKPSAFQNSYLDFVQCLCYLYPDLLLKVDQIPDSARFSAFSDSGIGQRIQQYYLKPWSEAIINGSPPLGNYSSDSEGLLSIQSDYKDCLPIKTKWLSLSSPLDTIMKFIHTDEVVYTLRIKEDKVLYWVCPNCSIQNNQLCPCKGCQSPIPDVVKQASSPVYYSVPSTFTNNYYITENNSAFFPVSYIRYPTPVKNLNLIQDVTIRQRDPIFHLPPHYSLSCYFPMDLNGINSLFFSLILPLSAMECITVMQSEVFLVHYNAKTSTLVVTANPELVLSFNGFSFLSGCVINKSKMTLETPFDRELCCSIHYSVINPLKIVVQVCNNAVICKLKKPIQRISAHISHISICNYPRKEQAEKVGILGLVVYHSICESRWSEIPSNAILFSFIGNHFSEDHGLRYLNEFRACRCSLKLSTDCQHAIPFSYFFEDSHLNLRNSFIVNEFCFYNSHFIMNAYVEGDTINDVLKIGHRPRMGSLYWKYLFSPTTMDVSFSFDLDLQKNSFASFWLTNETIPNHKYISMLVNAIDSFLSDNSVEEQLLPIPYFLDYPMLFIFFKKLDHSTMRLYYANVISGEVMTSNHLHIQKGVDLPIEHQFTSRISLSGSSLLIHHANGVMEYPCPDAFTQHNSLFLSGWSGLHMTLSQFTCNASKTQSSMYIFADKDTHLTKPYLVVESSPIEEYPCRIQYQDVPALGSTDPTLKHPKLYEGEGVVTSMDMTGDKYDIFAIGRDKEDCLYCQFQNKKDDNSMLSIYSNFNAVERRFARSSDCVFSCFGNNRIQRYGKNCSGIANSNNTCFQNSTLQLLFHSDSFKLSLFNLYNAYEKNGCTKNAEYECMKELVQLLTHLQITIRGYEVNKLVEVLQKRFEIGYQHDMNEYFDHLLDVVDTCYNTLKKESKANINIENPVDLMKGKQQEMMCCECGHISQTFKEGKETEFHNSYISLTSSIAPVTNVSFELLAYDAIPSTPFTTYIYVFEYKSKGVFLVLERNPTKTPISNLIMKDKHAIPSKSVRIPSFHTYVSSQLYYQPFMSSYSHEMILNEEGETETFSTNHLVVDVLIRSVTSNSCEISQTNNGVFELVGVFEHNNEEYEIYQKIVDTSTALGLEMKGKIEWNDKFILSETLPAKCDSVKTTLSNVVNSSNFTHTEKNAYLLFSQQIDLGTSFDENALNVIDKDGLMKMALYGNRSLVGLASVERDITPCRGGSCEMIFGDALIANGPCFFSSSTFFIFDETYFDSFEFKIVGDESTPISAIEFDNIWYHFQGCQECDTGLEYLYISEQSQVITLLLNILNDNGQMRNVHYTHRLVNNTTPFEGKLVMYETQSYLFIPHSPSFSGCYYSLYQQDPYLPIEQMGSSFWYQKKKLVTNDVLCYIYSGYHLSYAVYTSQIQELSIASMVLSSLNIQDTESNTVCQKCNTPVCKRNYFTSFPDYLPISISRTFFDTSTYTLTKDCSHVYINPTISILHEYYDIYAIVVHLGYSFDSGHYVVYCRHSDDENNITASNSMNRWCLFNDDTVYPYEWSEVVAQLYDYGACPYFVVYRRRHNLPKSVPASFLPSYFKNLPLILNYDKSFVKNAEDKNDSLLSEIPSAPFLLRKLHVQC